MTAAHDRIPEQALEWLRAGKGAALATVVSTWGSAPRQPGAQLAISSETELHGSVSGGCVEGAVAAEALEAISDGVPRLLRYGVSDADAFAVGLACGGEIAVLVEPVGVGQGPSAAQIEALAEARAARRAMVLVVNLTTWERRLIARDATGPLADAARAAMDADRAATEGDWFLSVHNPPLRLMIVGAAHIAQALWPMAEALGYDVTLIDPRDAFASEARFPGARLLRDWPDEALDALGLDQRCAVITLTHDAKLDDPAIMRALRSPAFYLGCLGSTRTHAKRAARLREGGFSEAEIARIHAPLGLDIGAKSPAEIALSALAELTERLRRPASRP